MIFNILSSVTVFLSIILMSYGLIFIVISFISKKPLIKYGTIFLIVGIVMYAASYLFELLDSTYY